MVRPFFCVLLHFPLLKLSLNKIASALTSVLTLSAQGEDRRREATERCDVIDQVVTATRDLHTMEGRSSSLTFVWI